MTSSNTTKSRNLDLTNKVSAAPLTLAVSVASASESSSSMQVRLNGQGVSNLSMPSLGTGTYRDVARTATSSVVTTASEGISSLELSYSTSDPQGKGYLEEILLHTRKRLIPSNGRLRFRDVSQVQLGGTANYEISINSSNP